MAFFQETVCGSLSIHETLWPSIPPYVTLPANWDLEIVIKTLKCSDTAVKKKKKNDIC